MHTETISYFDEETKCLGFIAYDEQVKAKRPAVLIAHAWRGQDDFAREKAIEMARLGFVGFAVDIYGEGKYAESNEEAPKLMGPFFVDRALLRRRIGAAFRCVRELSKVDSLRVFAIGFCFGGMAVYELLRSGAEIKAAVSFHGVFATQMGEVKAQMVPISGNAQGSFLILHGHEDPLVSEEDLKRVTTELTDAKIDWQLHIFSHTMHAFTNPSANNVEMGTVYNERSAARAWHEMQDFFGEVL